MIFCGIDIGKNEHGFAIVAYGNNNLQKPIIIKNNREGLEKALNLITKHEANKSEVVIGMETTGHYWKPAAYFFRNQGYRVDVFNALVSAKREQQNVRGCKSDKSSAVAIAKVVRDDDYSVCQQGTEQSEEIKALSRQRSRIVEMRSKIKTGIINYWDEAFPEIHSLLSSEQLYSVSGLNFLKKYATAKEIADAHLTSLKSALGRFGDTERATALRDAARKSIGIDLRVGYTSVMSNVRMLEECNREIKNIERTMQQIMKKDSSSEQIRSVPGIGLIVAAAWMSEFGDMNTFDEHGDQGKPLVNRILAYMGAEPRIRQSGKHTGKIKMSKRGNKHLRTAMFLAADNARKSSSYFKEIYDKHKEKGKHHYVALSHVMRKLLIILVAMLKTNKCFDEKNLILDLH